MAPGLALSGAEQMETKLIRVLLIESEDKCARFMRESLSALTSSQIELFTAETLADCIHKLRGLRFDAVLLNLFLKDSEGIATFARVYSQSPGIPIVIFTCHENEALALEALRKGAQDYLVKSKVDGKILSRVIRYAIERKRTELKLLAANRE